MDMGPYYHHYGVHIAHNCSFSVSLTGYKCRALGYLTDQLFARPKSSTVYVLISFLLNGSILPPPTLCM